MHIAQFLKEAKDCYFKGVMLRVIMEILKPRKTWIFK